MSALLLLTEVEVDMLRIPLLIGVLCVSAWAQAPIFSSETAFDFGTVRQGTKIMHGFSFKNSSPVQVLVKGIEFSMPGMTARFRPNITPGLESSITIEWDTAHLASEIDGRAIVHFADSSLPPITLRLKGFVQPPLEILPFPAVFLSAFQGEGVEARLRIVNHQEQPMTISLTLPSTKHFNASLMEVERGKIYELVTMIPAAVLPGRYDEELCLGTDDANGAGLRIPVHLFVKADLYANPDVVDFGSIALGPMSNSHGIPDLLTQTFLVKKRKGEFAITKITSDLGELEIRKDPLRASSSVYRIDVALNPQKIKTGKLEGFIVIDTNDKDFPEIKIPVNGLVF